jgi:hypothetical protein
VSKRCSEHKTCDRLTCVSPSTTVTLFLSEGHEGPHAFEHPRNSGSVPSVDQPKAYHPGALGERFVMCPAGDSYAKFAMLTADGPLLSSSRRIDIRQLDFVALKAAGYRGAVVDKDNCLVRLFSVLHSVRYGRLIFIWGLETFLDLASSRRTRSGTDGEHGSFICQPGNSGCLTWESRRYRACFEFLGRVAGVQANVRRRERVGCQQFRRDTAV